MIFLLGYGEEYLKIYLYKDTLTIKRPFSLFRKQKTFINSDIFKVVYELPKWTTESSRIIICSPINK
ncbi:MAG: hypothetical protein ACOYLE_08895 [Bacteroidales bacterium]